jgi:hypothetical protein
MAIRRLLKQQPSLSVAGGEVNIKTARLSVGGQARLYFL